MNFLTIGSLFLLFQLNLDWTSNYIVKLIGFLFFVGGIVELNDISEMQKFYPTDDEKMDKFFHSRSEILGCLKSKAFTMGIMCALAGVCIVLLKYVLKPAELAVNVISLILGVAVAFLSLYIFHLVYAFIETNERYSRLGNLGRFENSASGNSSRFVSDESNVTRLGSAFYKLGICTAVNLFLDLLNRLVPISIVSGTAGICMVITKILMYIFLIAVVYDYNKIRVDYNKKHDMEIE